MQAALGRRLSVHKYPYSVINSREFQSSRAVLDAKVKQLRMQGNGKGKTSHNRTTQPKRSLSGPVDC